MNKKSFWAVCLAASICAISPPALAGDLRLTPGHVYSTWSNLNDCLLAIGREQSHDETVSDQLASMEPTVYAGKKPADVLARVGEFQVGLNRLRASWNLSSLPQIPQDYERVTPREVYLNSGTVTDALVEILILLSGPEQQVSPFYAHNEFDGMSPSDVFGLVDLAVRRLEIILAESEDS